MVSGATRADPPGLPLGTGSLEATKVGTGGHGSGRRTPCGVLSKNVEHPGGIPFGPAVLSICLLRKDLVAKRVIPEAVRRTDQGRSPSCRCARCRTGFS